MARIKQSGKFHKSSNGKWYIDTKIKVDNKYVHIQRKGFNSLSEAKNELQNIENQFNNKTNENSKNKMAADELIDEYLKYRSYKVNITSLEKDKSIIRCHIEPFLRDRAIKKSFTYKEMQLFYEQTMNLQQSTLRKKQIISKMKDILNFAYTHKYIDAETYQDCDIVLISVSNKKENSIERIIWSKDEETSFLETIKKSGNYKDYLYFKIIINTGLRIGEFLALQGKSFDYNRRILKINQQVVNIEGQGWCLTDKLKTKESYRNVVLTTDLADEINEFVKDFAIKQDEFIIFSTSKDKPLSRTEFRRKLDRYCEIAGVRKLNPHALRHNQAVNLSKVCVTFDDLENAARRLGHSPSMFANTYAKHCNDLKQNELLERMRNI